MIDEMRLMNNQKKILLSICISSYNNGRKCVDLINKLLYLNDNRINVIVCDDHSDSFTQNLLREINDERFLLFENTTNKGACPNWFETLNHGNGRYRLHILDRDYIDTNILIELISILETNDVGIGYVGTYFADTRKVAAKSCLIYHRGEDTAARFGGIPIHPTGFLIASNAWKQDEFRKYFYDTETYGIYPHSYLMALVAVRYDLLIIYKVFSRFVYSQFHKSNFYQNQDNTIYWWEPEAIFDTSYKMIGELISFFTEDVYRQNMIISVIEDALVRGTIGYRREKQDKRQMKHYSTNTRTVTLEELQRINTAMICRFRDSLNKMGLMNGEMEEKVNCISNNNLLRIKNCFFSEEKYLDELVKRQEFYDLFHRWIELYESGVKLSSFFIYHQYNRVAIYGMKEVGELLYNDLSKSRNIEVVAVIDKNTSINYKNIDIISLNDVIPDSDVIVVTAIHYYNEIENELRNKVSCPVISIEDVLYSI